jgi:cyanophycin synthetase
MPAAYLQGAPGSSGTRIDFVQHALCAWLRYKELLQSPKPDAKPLTGKVAGHFRILIGGDTDFGESYQEEYARHGQGNILLEKGYDYSIANLSRLLQSVDYRILNLETPLTLHRDNSLKGKEYLHYSDPVKAPAALGRFGPIAYSLANNHTLDQGPVGLADTVSSLNVAGAGHFGAGKNMAEAVKPLIQKFSIGDSTFTVAVFGGLENSGRYEEQFHFYADESHPGVAPIDVRTVENVISDLRRQTPNLFVIYFMHVLQNYAWKSPDQVSASKALRGAGVDLVVGSGAHMMQEVEFDGGQWTFYGVGNFVFNASGRYSTFKVPPYSSPLVIDFSISDHHLHATFRIYPIVSDNKITRYQPRFLTEEELNIVDKQLSEKSCLNPSEHSVVRKSEDSIGRYLDFSSLGAVEPPK